MKTKFSMQAVLTAMAIALLASLPGCDRSAGPPATDDPPPLPASLPTQEQSAGDSAGDSAPSRHPFILATAAERPTVLEAIAASP